MNKNEKLGGGNKPQPYIPSGNGSKSGQYTSKPSIPSSVLDRCRKGNSIGKHNFCCSSLIKNVENHFTVFDKKSVPLTSMPNSVCKKIVGDYVVSERYYNDKGEPYIDIDYTDHKNPKTHPVVPHIHYWTKNEDGNFSRSKWEDFL